MTSSTGPAALVAEHVDLPRLRRIARPFGLGLYGPAAQPLRPLGQRIAVARDVAFAFAYPAVLDGWRAAGAEIKFFAPLADDPPDADATAVYLPGGYPELHAGRLAANLHSSTVCARRRPGVPSSTGSAAASWRSAAARGPAGSRPRHGRTPPVTSSFAEPRLHLGYRRMRLLTTSPLGQAGHTYRGHEFHYACLLDAGDAPPLFDVTDTHGQTLPPRSALRSVPQPAHSCI